MIGNDLYKFDVRCELSGDRFKSLILFYAPLIGNDALSFYEYALVKGSTSSFEKINELLSSLNISVDAYEEICRSLNEYRLLKSLNKDNQYVFIFEAPLTMKEFIRDDIFVRNFILKTSGPHYQELISDIFEENDYKDFNDVSKKLSIDNLTEWNNEDESYLKKAKPDNTYSFNTLFDVNHFLKDVSTNLFPMKYRTKENLETIATLADLYNISYDTMRVILAKLSNANSFDKDELKKLCMSARSGYQKVSNNQYDTPTSVYLMSLQDGKELTFSDKRIIYNLSNHYHLNVPVINVLLEHSLKQCNNRLLESYIYGIASDMHRNNINTSKEAIDFLYNNRNSTSKSSKSDVLPSYDTNRNQTMSKEDEEELLKLMGKQ